MQRRTIENSHELEIIMLFPETGHLNQGATGGFVTALHLLLIGAGYGKDIELDGIYGEVTVARVREFQTNVLGFVGEKADGQCGPATLDAIKKYFGLDLRSISREAFTNPSVGVDLVN